MQNTKFKLDVRTLIENYIKGVSLPINKLDLIENIT